MSRLQNGRRRERTLRDRPGWATAAMVVAAIFLAGCNDPYSQRRIERRWAQFDNTATDIADRERDGVRRLHEADDTLKKWWQRDIDQFNSRVPTIGDFFW